MKFVLVRFTTLSPQSLTGTTSGGGCSVDILTPGTTAYCMAINEVKEGCPFI